jgi:hypothetical protein
MKAPIIHISDFCTDSAENYFDQLWNIAWVRHDKVPRREYYVNDLGIPYSYGTAPFDRTYESQPTHHVIEAIRKKVKEELVKIYGKDFPMDVCFLNGYEDSSDQLNYHSDDSEEMEDESPIVIVSLYNMKGINNKKKQYAREIWFRPSICHVCKAKIGEKHGIYCSVGPTEFTPNTLDVEKLELENGSMTIMAPGMQDTHQHRIPKASFVCVERVSLTFRTYVKPRVK